MKKSLMKIVPIIVLMFVIMPQIFGLTASIGNARMILYPEVVPGEPTTIEKTILVKNINNISVNINLEAFQNLEGITEILDPDFILEPSEEKNARFIVTIDEANRYEGNIAVSFTPADEPQSSGVGLLSNIIIVAKESETPTNETPPVDGANPLVGFGIIAAIIAVGIILFRLKRRKHTKSRKGKR